MKIKKCQAGNQKISGVVTSLTHSGYFFFPIMPNKSTVFIKLPHKMIVYIKKTKITFVNCTCVCMLLRNKLSLIIFSFNVYFKMAASIASHFEKIKSQHL